MPDQNSTLLSWYSPTAQLQETKKTTKDIPTVWDCQKTQSNQTHKLIYPPKTRKKKYISLLKFWDHLSRLLACFFVGACVFFVGRSLQGDGPHVVLQRDDLYTPPQGTPNFHQAPRCDTLGLGPRPLSTSKGVAFRHRNLCRQNEKTCRQNEKTCLTNNEWYPLPGISMVSMVDFYGF